MDSTGNHPDDKPGLTPDKRLELWAASIYHKRRLGIADPPQVSRRGLLSAIAAGIAALLGSGRSGGGE